MIYHFFLSMFPPMTFWLEFCMLILLIIVIIAIGNINIIPIYIFLHPCPYLEYTRITTTQGFIGSSLRQVISGSFWVVLRILIVVAIGNIDRIILLLLFNLLFLYFSFIFFFRIVLITGVATKIQLLFGEVIVKIGLVVQRSLVGGVCFGDRLKRMKANLNNNQVMNACFGEKHQKQQNFKHLDSD